MKLFKIIFVIWLGLSEHSYGMKRPAAPPAAAAPGAPAALVPGAAAPRDFVGEGAAPRPARAVTLADEQAGLDHLGTFVAVKAEVKDAVKTDEESDDYKAANARMKDFFRVWLNCYEDSKPCKGNKRDRLNFDFTMLTPKARLLALRLLFDELQQKRLRTEVISEYSDERRDMDIEYYFFTHMILGEWLEQDCIRFYYLHGAPEDRELILLLVDVRKLHCRLTSANATGYINDLGIQLALGLIRGLGRKLSKAMNSYGSPMILLLCGSSSAKKEYCEKMRKLLFESDQEVLEIVCPKGLHLMEPGYFNSLSILDRIDRAIRDYCEKVGLEKQYAEGLKIVNAQLLTLSL